MIISHKYKYLFIQLEKTASTAIAKELRRNYEGIPILWKHARYEDFLKIATPEEKKYFVFAGIRNPLDIVVSRYYLRKLGIGNKQNKIILKRHNFIKENDADFSSFFKKFYSNKIYNDWKTKKFNSLDYIYRYENLQEDFSKVLKKLGIKQKGVIPLINKTPEKEDNFESYYSKDIQPRVKIVFGRYIKKWGYRFPKDWKEPTIWEKISISIPLNIKHFLYRMFHIIIDISSVHQKMYNLEPVSIIKNEKRT